MALRRVRVVALAIAALAAACSGGDGEVGTPDDATTTTTTLPTTTTRVVACVAGDKDPRSLAPVVVETVPGLTLEDDSVGNTGPSDLSKAIADDGQPDAERVLNGAGFRAGYQRLWTSDAYELALLVYEFCKPDGAEGYSQRTRKVLERAGAPLQPIVGRTVGSGFTLVNGSMRGLWLSSTDGPVLVQVIAYSDQADDVGGLLERAEGLLVAQLEALASARGSSV